MTVGQGTPQRLFGSIWGRSWKPSEGETWPEFCLRGQKREWKKRKSLEAGSVVEKSLQYPCQKVIFSSCSGVNMKVILYDEHVWNHLKCVSRHLWLHIPFIHFTYLKLTGASNCLITKLDSSTSVFSSGNEGKHEEGLCEKPITK